MELKMEFRVIGSREHFEKNAEYIEKAAKLVSTGKLWWLALPGPLYSGAHADLEYILDFTDETRCDSSDFKKLRVYPIENNIKIDTDSRDVNADYEIICANEKSILLKVGGIYAEFFYKPKCEQVKKN
ncbi:MAG: hypothetical protein PHH54_00050 [Candidatus Nanoarchaeia archaeon]|nr:hypothetical protein [Candidatus Nanoarchaeia archaeon]MDD5740354.1 hypothetical protein [Candidatus Nanoarchaeia archaeon]